MPRYIAFLRSINVGGRNVKMAELRRSFEGMGFSNVETFIASGNVIFESGSKNAKSLEFKIEGELYKALGYETAVFVRSADELKAISKHKLFTKRPEGAGLYIAFLTEPPSADAKAKLGSFQTKTDTFYFEGRELYWVCQTRFSDSTFSGPRLEKVLGMQATVRNCNTVAKMVAKYGRSN